MLESKIRQEQEMLRCNLCLRRYIYKNTGSLRSSNRHTCTISVFGG